MSLSIPSRRVLATAASTACTASSATRTTATAALALRPRIQHSHIPSHNATPTAHLLHTTAARPVDWGRLFGRKKKAPSTPGDVAGGFAKELSNHQTRQELRERMTNSGLEASPLLAGEMEEAGGRDVAKKASAEKTAPGHRSRIGTSLLRADLQRAIDPDPRSRVRWERKMVVRQVGRMLDPTCRETKAERLARTERELLHQSTPLPTSTKKLMYLARQIAGKTLEDALVQMRFSKKKMAKEVIWLLEEARDMAIVERGMGLGKIASSTAAIESKAATVTDGAKLPSTRPLRIRTKDGRWLTITDPSRIYIDQAWVGKGEWRSSSVDYRARGRRFIKWSPSAFLSVVLKEENTRIRLHEERIAKEARKTPWVHLPNRPVTAQRPYYSW